jgi:hypothetical protein
VNEIAEQSVNESGNHRITNLNFKCHSQKSLETDKEIEIVTKNTTESFHLSRWNELSTCFECCKEYFSLEGINSICKVRRTIIGF